jgi:hypothetical protein
MKSKGNEIGALTRRSFLVGGIVMAGFLLIIGWIFTQEKDDGIPWVLRNVHQFNAEIWSRYSSPKRLSEAGRPIQSKSPRVNGDLGLSPFDIRKWELAIFVEDKQILKLKMKDISWLPKVDTSTEFKCIEGWSDLISYAGVRFSDFMKNYGRKTDYKYVGLRTPDGGYYVSIDMESMLHPQTLLAYEMNFEPLSFENGAPLRLIIPIKYGIKSLKRIGSIQFSNTRPPDYWAERGYDWFAGL